MQKPKMKCPECRVDMNNHAEKIDYSAALKEPEKADPYLGGIVQEFHTCPKCGSCASRKAE